MKTISLIAILLLFSMLPCAARPADRGAEPPPAPMLAPTPPMGWNSWDSYGTTVKEADVRTAARWMAQHLKPFGWQYVVVDMEWFVTNPTPGGNSPHSQFAMDKYGRYIPAPNRFPSAVNDAGFKPLADYVHSLGLKFGIHILRGIPKQAVDANLPIAVSTFHAQDAASTSDTCPWNPDNYGIDASIPAGQAYYDSIARLYASWGVDLIKVDCIANPYKGDEVRALSKALRKTNRPIVLSLSPGPAPVDKIADMRRYAQMWRISNDVWDLWHSSVAYPQGVSDQFPRVAAWAKYVGPGHWPDADMLPLGYLGPAPGLGPPRKSRLTLDEARTLMTLWCIFRSPLMWGGNPSRSDAFTVSLLTNSEVLEVDQHATDSHEVLQDHDLVAWLSRSSNGKGDFVAVFNLAPTSQSVHLDWKELSLPEGKYRIRDLWQHQNLPASRGLNIVLPPHGSVLYRITRE